MELVAIKTDLAFRAVFGRDNVRCKIALKELLNTVLNIQIQELTYVNPLNLKAYAGDKQSEMDIEVTTEQGERIDIEIQLRTMAGFKERIVYYGAKLLGEALNENEPYDRMKKCKVLSILDFTLFPETKALLNRFCLKEREQNYLYSDILELVFLEMPKLEEKSVGEMNALEKWLYFLKYVQDENRREKIAHIMEESEGVQMAYEVLREVSADERLRAELRFQEKAARDRLSEIAYAQEKGLREGLERGLLKGKKEGLKEGLEKGIQKGIQKGIEEGLEKGMFQKQREIAGNLLQVGLDDQTIMQTTGLDLETVRELRRQNE